MGELGELGDRYMAWHGMAWTANTHLFLVHLSRCSLLASTPLFLLSMKILKKQEIKRQLTVDDHMDDHMDHTTWMEHGMAWTANTVPCPCLPSPRATMQRHARPPE